MPEGTAAILSISNTKPKGLFNRALCSILGDWYCNWCIRNMLKDNKMKFVNLMSRNLNLHYAY